MWLVPARCASPTTPSLTSRCKDKGGQCPIVGAAPAISFVSALHWLVAGPQLLIAPWRREGKAGFYISITHSASRLRSRRLRIAIVSAVSCTPSGGGALEQASFRGARRAGCRQ